MKFLYKCHITKFSDSYNINCSSSRKVRTLIFHGNEYAFLLFLKRIKAMDVESTPKSIKNSTYKAMLDVGYFYVYSHMLPKQDIIKEHTISFFESDQTAKEYLSES